MDAVIGVRTIVTGICSVELIVARSAAAARGCFEPKTVLLRQLAENTDAEVADLAAAMRAVVQIGIVCAAPVFYEGAEEKLRCALDEVFTRPAYAKTPPFRVNVGAALDAHVIRSCACPKLVGDGIGVCCLALGTLFCVA